MSTATPEQVSLCTTSRQTEKALAIALKLSTNNILICRSLLHTAFDGLRGPRVPPYDKREAYLHGNTGNVITVEERGIDIRLTCNEKAQDAKANPAVRCGPASTILATSTSS
ncbi:hypothetical protein EG328_009033 [Venturia inaequalis]|uniref:Uncharacterized protein n=1 Tax=Venturia inaequalis TaxID=5025 RepID=A0A8H3UB25_VENIN|nr:hypothetical protein EG328_009033 [Venturia inaequalis]